MKTILALCVRNLKAFIRDRTRLFFSILFPFFFVYVFSSIFRNEAISDPVPYMLVGIIIATVFETALRISASTIDDMTTGFMKEVLVSPVARVSVAAGQFLSSAIIAAVEGFIILVVGFFIGFKVTSVLTLGLVMLLMIFVGLVFAGFGLFIATNTKNIQTFQIVSMAITMPMTFISGAYIPFSLLPRSLVFVGYINPVTYAVALFRTVALEKTGLQTDELLAEQLALQIGEVVVTPWLAMLILFLFGLLFMVLSTLTFVRTDFSRINRNKDNSIEW
ncbi:MAG: ABC transporter permease [Peptococcaceae bacterium]|nr:ABC transporter permease [Peptococcaceae bacterium]